MNEIETAQICKALGDTNRLKIIIILTAGEQCACKLLEAFDIDHSTLSHHMKVLGECGLINFRKEGKWTYYSLSCEKISAFREFISSLICKKLNNTKGCCCK